MDRPQRREQTWIRRGIAALTVLACLMLGLLVWSMVQAAETRQRQEERTERLLDQVQAISGRLDEQAQALADEAETVAGIAARLDRQAETVASIAQRLDRQTDVLTEQSELLRARSERADRSREQFQQAARAILEALEVESDVFTESTSGGSSTSSNSQPSTTSREQTTTAPEPEPTMDNGRPCPPQGGPKECR